MQHHVIALALALACAAPALADGTEPPRPRLLDQLERALQAAARRASASVVSIEVSRVKDAPGPSAASGAPTNPFQKLMRDFMGGMRNTHKAYYKRPAGPVSGFVTGKGQVLTSWYNVAGELDGIRVTFADGRSAAAKLLGTDRSRDIAMLAVDTAAVPPLAAAEGGEPAVGSFAAVVSRGVRADSAGLTWGIISATTRDRGERLQVDARVNYGSSGAPVVDLHGRLRGMVVGIAHWNQLGVNSGVSYASKSSLLAKLHADLAAGKHIKGAGRPLLGIAGESAPDGSILIKTVTPGSGAASAGIQVGDRLTVYDGTKVDGIQHLIQLINRQRPGHKVVVKVVRGEQTLDVDVVLGERKEGQ